MKLNHPSISTEQGKSVGITVTFSNPATQVSQRQHNPRSTEKVYIPPSRTNLADLAKNKRHSQKHDIVLSKLFIMTHQRALCVHLVR